MKYKHTGRIPPGSVVNKDSAWLDSNDGLLISGVAGKSVVICDVSVSTGSGKKLGTSANGGGTLIAYVSSGSQSIRTPIKVEEGESVYTDASASVTVTYYLDELSGSPVSIPLSTTTTPSGVVTNFYFALASSSFPEESNLQNNIHTVVVQRNTTIAGASVGVLTGAWGDTATATVMGHIDDDYTHLNTTLTFGEGVTSQNISIAIEGDTDVEPNEFFSVNLNTPVQTGGTGVITGTNPHVVTILNDDVVTTTTAAPTNTLCITGATNSGAFSAAYINGGYAKEVPLEAGKVQYKRAGDALDDFGWVFWTTWGGGYWVVAHDNGSSSYSWAYQSAEDVATPYDVSTWSLASGAAGSGWGGTLDVDSGDCPTTTTTAAPTTTTTTTTSTTTTLPPP